MRNEALKWKGEVQKEREKSIIEVYTDQTYKQYWKDEAISTA